MKRLYIIDGSGYLYRSYFGLPPLMDEAGNNIHVLFGCIKIIIKLLIEKPDYFLIAWDMPGKTTRHDAYEQYKATRVAMPDDLKQQIPMTKNLIEELGIPSIGISGYEADDIIATATIHAQQLGIHTSIFSSDKDLLQLLSSTTIQRDPIKQTEMNPLLFQYKYGFTNDFLIDYLSLLGDSADNIPGVLGIGEKTAKMLIKKFGNIENIYNNIATLSANIQTKLETNKDNAFLSKSLISLQTVPNIDSETIQTASVKPNIQKYKDILLHKYKFASLDKTITALEKVYLLPQQDSLFG